MVAELLKGMQVIAKKMLAALLLASSLEYSTVRICDGTYVRVEQLARNKILLTVS